MRSASTRLGLDRPTVFRRRASALGKAKVGRQPVLSVRDAEPRRRRVVERRSLPSPCPQPFDIKLASCRGGSGNRRLSKQLSRGEHPPGSRVGRRVTGCQHVGAASRVQRAPLPVGDEPTRALDHRH